MDDLTGKINELLSDPESMEKIKNLAGMFAASGDGSSPPDTAGKRDEKNGGSGGLDDSQIDPEMLLKLKNAMDLMKKDDPRVDFLIALKPNLSSDRRKKVDEAIHILRLLSLMPMLRDQGIF